MINLKAGAPEKHIGKSQIELCYSNNMSFTFPENIEPKDHFPKIRTVYESSCFGALTEIEFKF